MRGACVSWCALFTQRQPRRELMCRALSALFILTLRYSPSRSRIPCLFFALVRTSPHEYWRGQAPDVL